MVESPWSVCGYEIQLDFMAAGLRHDRLRRISCDRDLTAGNGLNLGPILLVGDGRGLFSEEIDPELVRNPENGGFSNGTVQYFGWNRDLLVRIPLSRE